MAWWRDYLYRVAFFYVIFLVLAGPSFLNAELSVIGALVVGAMFYAVERLWTRTGMKVGAQSALIYFVVMLVVLAIRYLLIGPL